MEPVCIFQNFEVRYLAWEIVSCFADLARAISSRILLLFSLGVLMHNYSVEIPLAHSRTSVYPQGNLLCLILRELSINSPVLSCLLLSVKTDARHQIVAPSFSPQRWLVIVSPTPFRLRARLFPYFISTWGIWEWGLPVRIYY